ncbi:hypothetical protein [Pseudomonas sp.]|uniref:hypothetical protein n=1 Tax=Pseudomonas sp. TaxID=306 RepID=UPI003266B0B8
MTPYRETEQQMREGEISYARESAYRSVIPYPMNRKERRMAHGRMLVAQAELAALQAEIEVTRRHLQELTA